MSIAGVTICDAGEHCIGNISTELGDAVLTMTLSKAQLVSVAGYEPWISGIVILYPTVCAAHPRVLSKTIPEKQGLWPAMIPKRAGESVIVKQSKSPLK